MNDSPYDENGPTQSPNIQINLGFPVGENQTKIESIEEERETLSGSGNRKGISKNISNIFWVAGGMLSIGLIIAFCVSIIISQNNINNSIENIKNNVINIGKNLELKIKSFEDNFNYFKENTTDELDDINNTLKNLK